MDRNCTLFIQDLSLLNPQTNESEFINALQRLIEPLEEAEFPQDAIPAVFDFFERFPDTDMGSPGPLVHFVERFYPSYFETLVSSLERKPTPSTLWMLNRILNANIPQEQRSKGLAVLKVASQHLGASSEIKNQALHFLKIQNSPRA